jgi:hypothetical protein
VCTLFYYLLLARIEKLVTEMNEAVSEFAERYLPAAPVAVGPAAIAGAAASLADEDMEPAAAGR